MKLILGDKQMKEALRLYLEHILNQEHGAVEVVAIDNTFSEYEVTFTQEPKK